MLGLEGGRDFTLIGGIRRLLKALASNILAAMISQGLMSLMQRTSRY